MVNYELALMTGIDFPVMGDQLIFHPPTIKEISYFGTQDFYSSVQLICINKSMYENSEVDLSQISNFDLFNQILAEQSMAERKVLLRQILELLFPKYSIMMTPRSILFNQEGKIFTIDEGNFEEFQKTLQQVLCLTQGGQQAFNPGSKKAQEIAQKLQRARERVAAQKQAEGNGGDMFSQYLSVITVGIGSMSLNDAINLTLYQFYDLIERYSLYINWDIDIRSRMAGAKGDKPIENWMKNIH